jgi:hypothetical protein
MSHRYEFVADQTDGLIRLPDEITSRLRVNGIHRLRVVVTSVADDESRLAERDIVSGTIDRVAATQHIDRDVATIVLSGEGAAEGTELGTRLAGIMGRQQQERV